MVFLGYVFMEALLTTRGSSFSGNLEKGGKSDKNCNISSFMISPNSVGCVYPHKNTTTQENVKVNPGPWSPSRNAQAGWRAQSKLTHSPDWFMVASVHGSHRLPYHWDNFLEKYDP
jgi:hypothetical protein